MDTFSWGEYKTITFLLDQQIKANGINLIFLSDARLVPFAISCTCLFLQIIQVILHWINTFQKPDSVVETGPSLTDTQASTFSHSVKKKVKSHGGWAIYFFMMARLFGCLILFALSVKSLLRCQRNHPHFSVGCPEAFITMTFFYSSVMAIVSVTVKDWSASATRYNILVLLSVFGVYLYRDFWPLATVSQEPKDLQEGYMLWIKFSIITLTAVIIPLFIPRKYVPVDPKDPMPEPNPEQTCSLFALMFFTYLDPVIILGYRVPHLRFDQLPPLSDSDYSKHITRDAFPHLDPYSGAKRRHLFFGLMRFFRVEYMILSVCLIGQMFAIFSAPIGINRLLNYLETGGADAFIRPWFWIFWLFAGQIIKNICVQWYTFVSARTLVRTEATGLTTSQG